MEKDRNSLRKTLQQEAANKLSAYRRLIARWATGTGKSGIVLEFLKKHPAYRTFIVVPEVNNIENWRNEFEKFNVPLTWTTIICYASLKNYVGTAWDLVVYDEVPHVDTDLRAEFISTIDAKYVLALGAVVSDEEQAVLELVYGKFASNRISLDQAIKMGILPSPEVRVCHMLLDNTDKAYTYDGRTLTAQEVYNALQIKVNNALADYNSNATAWNKRRMLQLGSQRKRFLGEQKTNAIRYICMRLAQANKRFICFCSSIKQAELLGKDHAFTSKTPASMKVLDKFNNHEINSLYVVGKLIEGQNLKDIDCGVIGQLGGKERITVQVIGRVMRSDEPIIYVPVYDGTKDDGFMCSLTSSISDKYIKHYKL